MHYNFICGLSDVIIKAFSQSVSQTRYCGAPQLHDTPLILLYAAILKAFMSALQLQLLQLSTLGTVVLVVFSAVAQRSVFPQKGQWIND